MEGLKSIERNSKETIDQETSIIKLAKETIAYSLKVIIYIKSQPEISPMSSFKAYCLSLGIDLKISEEDYRNT